MQKVRWGVLSTANIGCNGYLGYPFSNNVTGDALISFLWPSTHQAGDEKGSSMTVSSRILERITQVATTTIQVKAQVKMGKGVRHRFLHRDVLSKKTWSV